MTSQSTIVLRFEFIIKHCGNNTVLHTYIHTYIQKFILTRWPQQLRADFHEGREFRKKTYYTDRRFKIEQRKNNYYQDIIR